MLFNVRAFLYTRKVGVYSRTNKYLKIIYHIPGSFAEPILCQRMNEPRTNKYSECSQLARFMHHIQVRVNKMTNTTLFQALALMILCPVAFVSICIFVYCKFVKN